MDIALFKKDMLLMFRNRVVLLSLALIFIFEIFLVLYSMKMSAGMTGMSRAVKFVFLQNHLLIFFFPVIAVNILSAAFSLSCEKSSFMLSRLIPYGETNFLRSKVMVNSLICSVVSLAYLSASIILCGIYGVVSPGFLFFLSFYLIFTIISISTFSVYFPVRFYEGGNDYEPGLKGVSLFMLFISAMVIGSFGVLMRILRAYYEFVTGYRQFYPNKEFMTGIMAAFTLLVFTRILLGRAEKKLRTK